MQKGASLVEENAKSDIVLIPSTKGMFFMVDAADEELVRQYKWCANRIGHGWYAVTWNKGKHTLLHRMLMNPPPGMVVDHINGDTLNCCRWNMRVVTRGQNNLNRVKKTNSVYKGISKGSGGKWIAKIQLNGSSQDLGAFDTAVEAAQAYDRAARQLHGSFARLNFPAHVPPQEAR